MRCHPERYRATSNRSLRFDNNPFSKKNKAKPLALSWAFQGAPDLHRFRFSHVETWLPKAAKDHLTLDSMKSTIEEEDGTGKVFERGTLASIMAHMVDEEVRIPK